MLYVIGVDPGLRGGVTLMAWTPGCTNVETFVMPVKPSVFMKNKQLIDTKKLRARIDEFELPISACSLVMLERQSVRPGIDGLKNAFTNGTLFGELICFFEMLDHEPELPTSQAWKKEILGQDSQDKAAAIAYCEANFPSVKLLPTKRHKKQHDGMADSVCIAAYTRLSLEKRNGGVSKSCIVHRPAAGDPGRGTADADGRKVRRRRRPASAAVAPDVVPVQGDTDAD